ncbi:MAG: hypothetical protein ASARMPRED_001626 [Alectoria sarmentosa]|nr:MAG: hypothetical protein ASARMPRED_001626 [Alectoria sarmentosa]
MIHPLLKIAAATELNFLGLIEARLEDELEPSVLAGRKFNLSTLLHTKKSLNRRTYGLSSNIRFIQSYQDLDWPKAANESSKDMRKIVEELQIDFKDLLALTHALVERCNESISLIQAVVTVRQADRAMEESQSLKRLTVLAFFFVPLSFTTSIFGMNLRNFSDQNSLSIWIWIVVAVPVALISSLLWFPTTLTVLHRRLNKQAARK